MEILPTIGSFLMHAKVEKGLSTNTVMAYKRDLAKFEAFAQKRKLTLEGVTRDDLVDFLAGLYRRNLESKSVARHLVTLRNFFRFAQIQELISSDPSINLESPKIRRSLPGYLRLEEVEKLLLAGHGQFAAIVLHSQLHAGRITGPLRPAYRSARRAAVRKQIRSSVPGDPVNVSGSSHPSSRKLP